MEGLSTAMLEKLPHHRSIETLPPERQLIHAHFSSAHGFHWYAAGFDGKETFLGFVNLADPLNAEWGYFTLSNLWRKGAEVEVYQTPVLFPQISWRAEEGDPEAQDCLFESVLRGEPL